MSAPADFAPDPIAERRCVQRIPVLRAAGQRHLKETTAEAASLEFTRRELAVEVEWSPEPYGGGLAIGSWAVTVTRRRPPHARSVVVQGCGHTLRGALVMALTDLEWSERG